MMNGIILFVLCNISHVSSTNCSEVMSKITQKDSGQERFTAKSKPMMNLSLDKAQGILTCLPLLHRNASGKPEHQRTGRLVKDAYSLSYSEWNADKNLSSQEWKSDELMEVRPERLVNEQPTGLLAEHTDRFIVVDGDMVSNTVALSDIVVKIHIILVHGEDRVAKMLDQSSKDAAQDSKKHSLNVVNVYVFDITTVCIQEKQLPGFFSFHQKERKGSCNETDVRHI